MGAIMQNNFLWKLAIRLWPKLEQLEPSQQLPAYISITVVILHLPLAIIALIGLTVATDLDTIRDAPLMFALLAGVLLLMEQYAFQVYIEMANGDLVPVSGSIGSIVVWSAALIYGPTALWLTVLVVVFSGAKMIWQLRQTRQSLIWSTLSNVVQGLGRDLPATLLGLVIFSALGGDYPLEGLASDDWSPALVGITCAIILEMTLLILFMTYLNRQLAQVGQAMHLAGLLRILIAFAILIIPFPILAALIDSEASRGLYLLFTAGVVLVNYLAHHLSRTVERSQQRTRELAQLEALGEAIIQGPPDLTTLPDLLQTHVTRMFPQDRLEIKLFDSDLPEFHIRTAPHRPPVEDMIWESLRTADEPYTVRTKITLSGTTLSGSSLTAKILADAPGQEGGEKEQLLGGIHLLRAKTVGKITTSLPAIQALASQIGSAYYRAQAHRETMVAQKMAQELELAGRIQSKFLPTAIPDLPRWDIAAGLVPARQTSGDFYDFIPQSDGHLGLLVADVADKGTGAALFMALSRTLIRTYAMQHDPAEAIHAANARILTDAESDQFVTVFYGVLDTTAGHLTYVNAGHNPAFVINGPDEPQSLTKTGIPLGMFDHMPWQQQTIDLPPGSILVLYSDGVSEAQNAANEEFGETRLLDTIQANQDRPACEIHTALMDDIRAFVGNAPQFDDITLMIVKRQP